MSLDEALISLKPMLEEYAGKKNSIQKQIIQEGIIPIETCDECKNKTIIKVIKFDTLNSNAISEFVDWISSNRIEKMECDRKEVYIISKKKEIEGKKGKASLLDIGIPVGLKKEEPKLEFKFAVTKFKNRSYSKFFDSEFYDFSVCNHITDETTMRKALPVLLEKTSHSIYRIYDGISKIPRKIGREEEHSKELNLICELSSYHNHA